MSSLVICTQAHCLCFGFLAVFPTCGPRHAVVPVAFSFMPFCGPFFAFRPLHLWVGLDGRLVVWEIPTLDIDMQALGL